MRSNFYKIFPVPTFLEMPAVGFDISDHSIRFAELLETRKGLVLKNYGEYEIPEGIVSSGEIKSVEGLRKVFADLQKELSTKFVMVALPEEHAYLLELGMATTKPSDVRSMLELQLEEHVPIPPADALFDYELMDAGRVRDGIIDVAVSAVHRGLVDSYLETFQGTGLTPTVFEIEPESIARAVIPEGDKGTYMIMDFGKTRTGISIVNNGGISVTSTVAVGGMSLTRTIAKELAVSLEEAEKIKHERGFARTQENEALFGALMANVSILRDELIRHYNYWHEHPDAHGRRRAGIEKVILCGGDSNLTGFAEFLSLGLHAPVELARVMQNVNSLSKYVPEISFNDSLRYATAIGLALRRPR
ncbi:MAG: hypothetical protein A2408_02225 [Candidatus Yonathbacteria bacterium RIFOXYC1_FULL_52_10]|uniref:SHS2 domain-containing protein n=1 Tax=Candidatus Yonathbacteria bacterium RIFOXYD1_FULL_52_36 TaxID=1802730 RepID=A0A1G2SM94_9BACT|nr:MAG: hypothetical protein A2408_02225 [Candidatus Yonathbacteria bacterium RIFOXYC1_FULL_52_10]OHA86064.1 MAG: hypothetical protein A2591_01595 [Candidatus Yonathbacteria bacterium RIFOXYD1_FULL_52_36]